MNQRNLSDRQFKLLIGQEHELMKNMDPPNPTGRNQYSEVRSQSDSQPQPDRIRDRLAEEHGVSPKTVQRSADLYTSVEEMPTSEATSEVGFGESPSID